jgi:hypothetical protein
MNYQIEFYEENRRTRAGVWTATNLHTALKRAASGYPTEPRSRDIAQTGKPKDWYKLAIGQSVTIKVMRI